MCEMFAYFIVGHFIYIFQYDYERTLADPSELTITVSIIYIFEIP